MRTTVQDEFIRILRAELTGETAVPTGDPTEVLALAKRHQMEHIVSHALLKNGQKEYAKPLHQSIWMSEQQGFVLDQVRGAFNGREIPFIPLKGAVLRGLYPEGWMRNSCDIDVLVRESDLASAEAALTGLGYVKSNGKTAHDITFTAGAVCLELHYTLIEEYRLPQIAAVLDRVWDYSYLVHDYEYAMADEMFYFYHIAHMVKHFENGGCGVRSFVDLWMLDHWMAFDCQKREDLLLQGGILTFAQAAERLAEHWFSGGDATGLDTMEQFVFTGGAYGTTVNGVTVKKVLRGGRWRHILSRLFVPYAQLKRYYPVLQKHPYLLPVYEVVRWVQALDRKNRYLHELGASLKESSGEAERTAQMLQELELL